MLEVGSSIDLLLTEVQKRANAQLELLLDKLLQRVLYPPIARSSGTCSKHTDILSMYREIACLKTKYQRLQLRNFISDTQLNSIEKQYRLAREAYRGASCTCIVTEPLPNDECEKCGALLKVTNGCRHPIHLAYKKGEAIPEKQNSWTYDNLPLSFDSGSGW